MVIVGVAILVSLQVRNFLEDSEDLEKQFYPTMVAVENFVLEHTPLEKGKLESYKEDLGIGEDNEGQDEEKEVGENGTVEVLGATFSFLADFLLMFVYLYLFLFYRKKFFKFAMLLFPKGSRDKYKATIVKSVGMVQHYLGGRLILMVFLVILYTIGLWISGVENFVLASLIGAYWQYGCLCDCIGLRCWGRRRYKYRYRRHHHLSDCADFGLLCVPTNCIQQQA